MNTSNHQATHENINSVYFIGNYLPRKCGIATFTTNLVESIASGTADCRPLAIAVNDRPQGYDYPERVRFEISRDQLETYNTAADFINRSQADVVCLQHEFGIFGGRGGEYILNLLQGVNLPVTATLHTVLAKPDRQQKSVMSRLDQLSDRFIVMSRTAIHILNSVYDIPEEKITHIPHGIPDIPFVDPNYYKDHFDLLGRKVLLTFGLLSENKGIETVLKALPQVIDQFPDLIYIVLGATHPQVLQHEGEAYREKLHQIVKDLQIEDNVEFKNRFVPQSELCDYLAATNIYITPYHNENQITSGTLAYAAGAGKAIISTPYWYAKEMLSDGRGRLVPFKDHNAMGKAIIEMFTHDARRHKMRKRIYDFNRNATWEQVGRQYSDLFKEVKKQQINHPKPHESPNTNQFIGNGTDTDLPPLKLNHLLSLTDDTGLLQHACYKIARRTHGYCTDDNARALILTLRARYFPQVKKTNPTLKRLSERYLAFLLHAFNPETARFRNFMSYSRKWLETTGSEDAHGRALWALGNVVYFAQDNPYQSLSATLFLQALPATESFQAIRAKSFALLGTCFYLREIPGDSQVRRKLVLLSEQLVKQFNNHAAANWLWPENKLTYANARLPHALILAGDLLQRDDIKQTGFRILKWLLNIQTEHGHLTPVGNHDWFKRSGEKARFDQQPLEANALTEACLAAFEVSGNTQWIDYVQTCFQWFLGHNDLKLPLVDLVTGGCRDGLQCDQVNQNEGAESTLAWLLSLTAMHIFSEKEDTSIDYSVIHN